IGTSAANDLSGAGGSDRIVGLAGSDNLYGYDIANAGTRRDKDRIDGGDGDDDIDGSDGPDVLEGGAGRDTLSAGGGDDRIAVRDRSTDAVECGRARLDSVTADALDFLPAGCERVRRRGAARAVPLRSFVGSQDDGGPGVEIGCSVDGSRTCRGSVRLYARGRLRGTRRFRARRGTRGFVSFPRRLRGLEGRRVRIVVRAPDRRGRGRTVALGTTVDTEG
ncbi:MAG: hypothetical protein M3131_01360, partial [Actinomycetota bacterium]|nr:hypothetical protein [Actinomycetota bacterium]